MRRRLPAFCFAFAAILAAGCVGEPTTTSTTFEAAPPSATASAPSGSDSSVATVDLGSVRGFVLSDENMPILGARVTLFPEELTVVTAESGEFAFLDLEPGTKRVYVEAFRFQNIERVVTVEPGQAVEVQLLLAPVSTTDPRIQVQIVEGFFPCAYSSPAFTTFDCTLLNVTGQSRSTVEFNMSGVGLHGYMTETVWTANSALSSQRLSQYHWHNGEAMNSTSGESPIVYPVPGPFGGVPFVKIQESFIPQNSDGQPVAVAFEQRFKVYLSSFYDMDLDTSMSAVPPE